MSAVRITVLNAPGEPALPGLEGLESAEVEQVSDPEALARALPETDVLVVTDFRTSALSETWPEGCPVRWVHATSAGVDALMFDGLLRDAPVLTNARGVFDRGIAEYVLGAVLMFAKDTLGNLRYQREHRWVHRETQLVLGKRALVVGAGSIGHEVGRLLAAVGMTVEGVTRSARDDAVFGRTYPTSALDERLAVADYVVITAPLTPETEGLFDAERLGRMREGACLINVGRGPIVRTGALLDALRSGRLAGAALDVFEEEPLPADHPLWDREDVMISAHMAGDHVGWRESLGRQFVELYQRWSSGEDLPDLLADRKLGRE